MMPSVIVIDDSPAVTTVISELLTANSVDVLGVGENGKEAVELYKKYSPDFVVMDYLMPDFNGLYGLQNIRKINSNAKVIMFTGSADPDLFDKFRESGVFAIVEKPIAVNSLAEIIHKESLGKPFS